MSDPEYLRAAHEISMTDVPPQWPTRRLSNPLDDAPSAKTEKARHEAEQVGLADIWALSPPDKRSQAMQNAINLAALLTAERERVKALTADLAYANEGIHELGARATAAEARIKAILETLENPTEEHAVAALYGWCNVEPGTKIFSKYQIAALPAWQRALKTFGAYVASASASVAAAKADQP